MTVHDFADLMDGLGRAQFHPLPWYVVGVLPTRDEMQELVQEMGEDEAYAATRAFGYSTGLSTNFDVWVSATSVEGIPMGMNEVAGLINAIGWGLVSSTVQPGDTVALQLEGCDHKVMVWVGDFEVNDHRRQTYQSKAQMIVPLKWSSPHGQDGHVEVSNVREGELIQGEKVSIPVEGGGPITELHLEVSVDPRAHSLNVISGVFPELQPPADVGMSFDWQQADPPQFAVACDCGWFHAEVGPLMQVLAAYASHMKEAAANAIKPGD